MGRPNGVRCPPLPTSLGGLALPISPPLVPRGRYDTPRLVDALDGLNLGGHRWPAGSPSNHWNWSSDGYALAALDCNVYPKSCAYAQMEQHGV